MKCRTGLCLALLGIALAVFAGNAFAVVQGACVNCHTMHNSQDGAAVIGSGPVEALLNKASCAACHTGTNDGLDGNNIMNGTGIPYVTDTGEPTYGTNTLAGGSFYWVGTGSADTKGHNVVGVTDQDSVSALGYTPPGWDEANYVANGQINEGGATWNNQLTCAGTFGCHGEHGGTVSSPVTEFDAVGGAHHADDSTIDGSTVAKSYRFLFGIEGKEDVDWEYTNADNDHNQYMGSSDTKASNTISYLCAECHGKFHTAGNSNGENGVNPWLRHPTDLDMNTLDAGTEYKSYGGATNAYVVQAPVASTDVSAVKATVLQTAGDAIVTCLSCHRAHGSPNDDLLRWDYADMVAGGGSGAPGTGCFHCHTTKDD